MIQLHVLGRFLPSFFTGAGMPSFAFARVFLGVGWNFLYVGGTTLLTSGYRPAGRAIAQSFNDMTIFIVGLASSLGAGALLRLFGWQTLNLVLLPWLALAGLAIFWLALSRRDLELAAAPASR